jgi:protein Hikeshi
MRINEFQFTIPVPDFQHANHLVVYMTGEAPFPDGYGGAVYLNYQVGNEVKWIFLGKICNEKPSAIFKIGKLKEEEGHLAEHPFGDLQMQTTDTSVNMNQALIGISIEPIHNINALIPTAITQVSNLATFVQYTQKMLENFFNYAVSFSKDAPDRQSYVPMNVVQNWFNIFQKKLQQNPDFWKNL